MKRQRLGKNKKNIINLSSAQFARGDIDGKEL